MNHLYENSPEKYKCGFPDSGGVILKRTNRLLILALAFVMVFTSVLALGFAAPGEVHAADTLDLSTIKVGDHIYMGKDNVDGFIGSPYWRVLDVDINNETAFLMSEGLWGDANEQTYPFSNNTTDGEATNDWSKSFARKWCGNFYANVLGGSSLVKKTSKTDKRYTTKKSDVYGTSVTYDSCVVDDYVFLLSAEEVEKYMSNRADRVARYSDGISDSWWLRSPSDNSTSYMQTQAGYLDNMFEFNYCSVSQKYGLRPAFNLDLSSWIDASKDANGDWVIRESTGGNAIDINSLRTGTHVYMGRTNASGYTGLPYWRVLGVDQERQRALLLSEYLWRGDGSDPEGVVHFDADVVANSGQTYPNEWQGSDAQKWCADFYRNVLCSSGLVRGASVTESEDTKFEYRVFGPSSLTESDKVFFLSAAEIKTYFNNTDGQGDTQLIAYFHDGSSTGDAGDWWVRSPYINSSHGGVCRANKYGFMYNASVEGEYIPRPAFYLDLSAAIPATKDSAGDWVVEGYGPGDEPVTVPVTLSSGSEKVAVGKSLTLKASGPSDISFKSSNKAVATVTSAGKVTAVKPGTATITAYSKSDKTNKAECKVTVKYKLTYKMNGGTNSADNPTWYTGKVTLKNPKTRKGYDFKGWYTDSKYKTKVTYVKNANKTLYAKWSAHSYKIKFDKNGGTGTQDIKSCKYGKEYSLPECKFTKKGYSFIGWNTKADGSGKAYADKETVKNLTATDGKTITLYAQWKIRKYTVKYSGLPEGAVNENKTSYTINTATFTLKNASCPGYTFKGWYSDSKKTKKITSIEKGSTGNKTIYSKWSANKYAIKFDANGGTGEMADMASCVNGKKYTLTANSFEKQEYKFVGWNTKADGSGTAYADGAEVSNLVTKSGGSITLYAQWERAIDLTDTAIYMKQNYGSSNCTLYACAHMMRRKAILDGRTDWTIINSDAVEDADSPLARAVWVNGQGLKAEFSYKMAEGYILNGHCVEVGSMGKERLIQLLKDHPEGIECYDMYTANPNMAHGVLVTSYDAATGIFYCVDSDPGQPAGIIPLSECLIGDHHGNTQDNALANIGKYWYLD